MKRPLRGILVLVSVGYLLACSLNNEGEMNTMHASKVADIFSDHMVLQRQLPIRVWGWSQPGSTVKVSLGASSVAVRTDPEGKWLGEMPAMEAGGPHVMRVAFENAPALTFEDVLIGEVWLASGQSNMAMSLMNTEKGAEAVAGATLPQMRLMQVPNTFHPEPQTAFETKGWELCDPTSVRDFSAVAYYFGRELQEALNVPVGIIHSSWGGTPIAAWTPIEALREHEEFDWLVKQHQALKGGDHNAEARRRALALEAYLKQTGGENAHTDPGNQMVSRGWARPEFDDAAWEQMELPCVMEQAVGRDFDGEVWFRREIDIPADWAGRSADLFLGAIDDFDTSYINGREIGQTGLETENHWMTKRHYCVPDGLLRAGRNVIAVRVFDQYLQGGMVGPAADMHLLGPDGQRIDLAGAWRYAIGLELLQKPEPENKGHLVPSALYNAMIHPLIPYTIRGAIWYQGESDAWQPENYAQLTSLQVSAWRTRWGLGDFPYYLVQLASYQGVLQRPEAWPRLRESQMNVPNMVVNTAVASAIDIGDRLDIHPRNKKDVGHRLALLARAKTYGEAIFFSGPVFNRMQVEDNKLRIHFDHAEKLDTADGESLRGFQIAGADQFFISADARIEGQQVLVHCEQIADPVAVRYAWESFPDANLVNEAGLPAFPFRSDDWPEKKD